MDESCWVDCPHAVRHCSWRGAGARYNAEAIRLNNRGVAQMGQQFTEKAADSFAEAFKKDPKLAQAAINEGIALMTLQKLDEAKKAFKDGPRARSEKRAGVVQPWSRAARGQRTGSCAGQLSAGREDRSSRRRFLCISRASATAR